MLGLVQPDRLEAAATDPEFLRLYDAALHELDEARTARSTWWNNHAPQLSDQRIAYFSAEFALHQSLPIYAGGLGVLAGDHCKEASDLGVPLIGVGFMYPQGYFHQHISAEGWQEESYERLNWADAPVEPATTPDGRPCILAVPLGERSVLVAVWRVRVGRVQLYLLDTDLEENAPWDRELSARLYGGDRETRIQQEIVLGIGGVRALKSLGFSPAAFHLNEGHAAFVVLQRIRDAIEQGSTFDEALEEIRATTIFTTHTPVAAGHDAFPFHLVEKHWPAAGARSAPTATDSWRWDRTKRRRAAIQYDSAGDAIGRTGQRGQPAAWRSHARMWAPIWPGVSEAERPVGSVTNGVHVATWIADRSRRPLHAISRGQTGRERHDDPDFGMAFWRYRTTSCGLSAGRSSATSSPSCASGRVSAGRTSTSALRASSPPARCSNPTR